MFSHFSFNNCTQPDSSVEAEPIDPAHQTCLSPSSNNYGLRFGEAEKAADTISNPSNRFRIGPTRAKRPASLALRNGSRSRRVSVSSITQQMFDQSLRDDTTALASGKDDQFLKNRFHLSQCPPTPPISNDEWDVEDENESIPYDFQGYQPTPRLHDTDRRAFSQSPSPNQSCFPPSPQLSEEEPLSPSPQTQSLEDYQNLREQRQCLSMIQCATTTIPDTVRLALAIDEKCNEYDADNALGDSNIDVSHPGELPSPSTRASFHHPIRSLQKNCHARAYRRSKGINKTRSARNNATRQPTRQQAVTSQRLRRRSLVFDLLTGFMEKEGAKLGFHGVS